MNYTSIAREIMIEFAERTGLQPAGHNEPRRYLWTDAFAVCNYLALARRRGRKEDLKSALRLVEQVHRVLGRHRDDDPRQGWLSGLNEREGGRLPTAGGLRIGKKLPERETDDPYDEYLEWERDGQYYHYLTKWMHALCCAGAHTGKPEYLQWAAGLAERSHSAFSYTAADGSRRLYWKMSIDLTRPQVNSMGHHDPLDGLLTCIEISRLQAMLNLPGCPDLAGQISDLADMCRGIDWATADPLGLGTLLADSWRLAQLLSSPEESPLPGLLHDMLGAAHRGLAVYANDKSLHLQAAYRLAFRELGLAIGLQAVPRIEALARSRPSLFPGQPGPIPVLENLRRYAWLQEQILQFWIQAENRQVPSWTEHGDINMVMLATCMVPEGFLDFPENLYTPAV